MIFYVILLQTQRFKIMNVADYLNHINSHSGGIMRRLWDFQCNLLPGFSEVIRTPEESSEILLSFYEKFGISYFYMMPAFDACADNSAIFLLRFQKSFDRLNEILPEQIKIFASPSVYLTPEIKTLNLKPFLIPKTKILPVRLPPIPDHPEMATALNHVLYHTEFIPLFLSFDKSQALYPPETIDRMLHLKRVLFQFRYQAFSDGNLRKTIRFLFDNQMPIFFGSDINSLENARFYSFQDYLCEAKKSFSDEEINKLLRPSSIHPFASLRDI